MSQGSTTLPTTGMVSGLQLVQAIQAALDSIATDYSGAADPGAIGAWRTWADTANSLLKLRNSTDDAWITIAPLGQPMASQAQLAARTGSDGPVGFRNKIINGDFSVNQDGVSGTVSLAAGQYGHSLWKAGGGGCTYTFSEAAGYTTLTISAGTLEQIVEGNAIMDGTHVLSWMGTAQASINGAAAASSGETADLVSSANTTISFGVGTLSCVQLEPGTVPTGFEKLSLLDQLARCEQYYERGQTPATYYVDSVGGGYSAMMFPARWRAYKRGIPAVTWLNVVYYSSGNGATAPAGTINSVSVSQHGASLYLSGSGLVAMQGLAYADYIADARL